MPFTLTCPHCEARLKTAAAIPAGKSVQCPKCKGVFASTGSEDDSAPPRRAAAPAPAPAKKRISDALDSASNRRRPADEDEEDERPRRRRREEEEAEEPDEPRARRRRRDEEEVDDEPPRRRRRDEEEDDDRPRRRRRDEEEDDDRPRRRRDEDDDLADEEEEARPKRKKKKQKKSNALFLVLMGVVTLAVIGGGVALVIMLMGGSSADAEMLAYAPADSKFIGGINVEEALKEQKIKEQVTQLLQKGPGSDVRQFLQQVGVTEDDLSQIMTAGTDPDAFSGKRGDSVVVVKLKKGKSIDRGKLKSAAKATEVQKEGKTYLKGNDGNCVYVPSDQLAVVTSTEASMAKVLTRNPKEIGIVGPLKEMVDRAAGSQFWVATVMDLKGGAPIMGAPPEVTNSLNGAKGFAIWGDVSGGKISFNGALYCASSEAASKASSALDKEIQKSRGNTADVEKAGMFFGQDVVNVIKEVVNSMSVSSSGSMLIASARFSYEPLMKMGQGGGFGLPGMGGLGGGMPQMNPNNRRKR